MHMHIWEFPIKISKNSCFSGNMIYNGEEDYKE